MCYNFKVEGSTDYLEAGHYYTNSGKEIICELSDYNSNKQEIQFVHTTLINNNFTWTNQSFISRLKDKEENKDEKDKLIRYLQKIDHNVNDIVILSTNDISQLYINTNKMLIPVQFSGHGIKKLLYIILSIMAAKNGILLIDEIETGFQYSMHKNLWKIVSDVSHDYNCQVIATTHSYENIIGAVEGVRDYPDDCSFYRLGYDRSQLKSYRFSYDLLKNGLCSNMEVR